MIIGSPIWLPQNQADVDKLGAAKEAKATPGIVFTLAQNLTQEDIENNKAQLERLAGSLNGKLASIKADDRCHEVTADLTA